MRQANDPVVPAPCPCGSGRAFQACCGPYLGGDAAPPSADTLMRSRYTAYVLGNEAYLLATWHARTRPAALRLDQEPRPRWLGLAVKRHEQDGPDQARVEFVARYKLGGRAFRLHEISRFERREGRWYYLDAEIPNQGQSG
jgi:SEC-C motif domain protein